MEDIEDENEDGQHTLTRSYEFIKRVNSIHVETIFPQFLRMWA